MHGRTSRLPRNRATSVTLATMADLAIMVTTENVEHRRRCQVGESAADAAREAVNYKPARPRGPCSACSACGSSKPPSANITDLVENTATGVSRLCGKGSKVVQVPLPPAVSRAIDRARTNLDRHPNYILAACMSSAT